jgi:hypothetical protein
MSFPGWRKHRDRRCRGAMRAVSGTLDYPGAAMTKRVERVSGRRVLVWDFGGKGFPRGHPRPGSTVVGQLLIDRRAGTATQPYPLASLVGPTRPV